MNGMVNALRLPVAGLMLLMLPVAILAVARIGQAALGRPGPWLPMAGGVLVFLAVWLLYMRRRGGVSWLYTLEHEATHAIFAVLTFNRVTSLHAGQGNGSLSYQGAGNWLVSLAPYFFPTFCVPALLALQVAVAPARPWLLALLGFSLALHVHSSWVETHPRQSDLIKHGRWASLCILPGAWLLGIVATLWCVPDYRSVVSRAWLLSWKTLAAMWSGAAP